MTLQHGSMQYEPEAKRFIEDPKFMDNAKSYYLLPVDGKMSSPASNISESS